MQTLKARDLMTTDVKSVSEAHTVQELKQRLLEWGISGVPVTGSDGRPVGVGSLTDIAGIGTEGGATIPDRSNPDYYLRGWEDRLSPQDLDRLRIEDEDLLVRDIMTRTIYDVSSMAPMAEVLEVMLSAHVHRVLVTEDEAVVGIISTFDVLQHLASDDSGRPPIQMHHAAAPPRT